jgi:ribosomal protein S18 acetylase RimI-like enzyme
VEIRRRRNDDLDAAVHLAELVHELDGYPRYLPHDLRSFLTSKEALGSWVALQGTDLVGHVALHRKTSRQAMALAGRSTGLSAERLAVIARLLVAPAARRTGIGRALLKEAQSESVALGRTAFLDVVVDHTAAVELYERCGWSRAGRITVEFEAGRPLEEFVYLSPEANVPAARPST